MLDASPFKDCDWCGLPIGRNENAVGEFDGGAARTYHPPCHVVKQTGAIKHPLRGEDARKPYRRKEPNEACVVCGFPIDGSGVGMAHEGKGHGRCLRYAVNRVLAAREEWKAEQAKPAPDQPKPDVRDYTIKFTIDYAKLSEGVRKAVREAVGHDKIVAEAKSCLDFL